MIDVFSVTVELTTNPLHLFEGSPQAACVVGCGWEGVKLGVKNPQHGFRIVEAALQRVDNSVIVISGR
ncbi:hypothetical protein L596_022830 [Steinernema carpocapsae]|uniref:Uncharacterized protein n=1 Tax=Steinernema carpocapsae TaxID=34508 RepID=A0A4U5MMS6_STECR|nr:hypothetical protein L596_022830 [Steinernema carpocapsae]